MLIQTITNQKYNTNVQLIKQNTNFKGQLGEKVLQEISAKTPVNNMLKKLGVGALGLVSIAKLKDILETWKEKTEKDTKTIEKLVSCNTRMKQYIEVKSEVLSKKEEELHIKEKDLDAYALLNEKAKEQIDKKEIELNKRKNLSVYKIPCNT